MSLQSEVRQSSAKSNREQPTTTQPAQRKCTATGHHHHHHHRHHHRHHHDEDLTNKHEFVDHDPSLGLQDEDEDDDGLDSLDISRDDVESIISPSISHSQSTLRHNTLHDVAPPLPERKVRTRVDGPARDPSPPKKPFFASQGKSSGFGVLSQTKFFRPRASSLGNPDQASKGGDYEKWMSKLPSFNLPSIQLPSFVNTAPGTKDSSDKDKHALRNKKSTTIIDTFLSNPFSSGPNNSSVPVSSPSASRVQKAPKSQSPTLVRDFGSHPQLGHPPTLAVVPEASTFVESGTGFTRHSSDSNSLRRTVSRTSSIGSDTRFIDVKEQTNARYKAIKDSILPDIKDSFNFSTPAIVKKATSGNLAATVTSIADPLDRLSGDVVIMGGYRGSILKKVKPSLTNQGEKRIGKTLWIPMKVGFNLQNVDLEVPLDPEAELLMEDKVKATDMLTHIAGVDISRRLIKKLRSNPKVRLHVFAYDWRLSPHLASEKLVAFMANLPCNRSSTPRSGYSGSISELWNDDGPFVFAHSLGGLITRHAVNQRPDLFRCGGVLYAGVPQRCINVLGPLRNGDTVAFNKSILNAQANFSFRSTFVFLPEDGPVFIDKETGEELPLDLYDPKVWQEHNLSPCVSASNDMMLAASLLSTASEAMATFLREGKEVRDRFSKWTPPTTDSRRPQARDETSFAETRATGIPDTPETGSSGTLVNEIQDFAATGAGVAGPNINMGSDTSGLQNGCTLPLEVTLPYLERTLAETKQFRSELVYQQSLAENYPPFAVLYSKTTPTVKAAKADGFAGIKTNNYSDLLFGAGDGVVLAREAQLPPGYICEKRVHCDRGHIGLLGDLDAVGQCVAALLEARDRNKKRLLRTLGRNVPSGA